MAAKSASDKQAELANRIKDLLSKKDLPRKKIAADLKVTTQTLNTWASRGSIKREHCEEFAAYCETSLDYLLTGRSGRVARGESNSVMEFSRELDSVGGPQSQITRECPIVDIVDLPKLLPPESTKDDSMLSAGSYVMDSTLEGWIKNPQVLASMPVTIFDNTDATGLPTFAMQILSREYEPTVQFGALVAFATDILPDRGDFAVLARRVKGGFWTVGAGFFYFNHRVAVSEPSSFFPAVSLSDQGFKCFLHRTSDKSSVDPFTIDCYRDEWLTIGVGVYMTSWLNSHHRVTQTRLSKRLDRRFQSRSRIIESK